MIFIRVRDADNASFDFWWRRRRHQIKTPRANFRAVLISRLGIEFITLMTSPGHVAVITSFSRMVSAYAPFRLLDRGEVKG